MAPLERNPLQQTWIDYIKSEMDRGFFSCSTGLYFAYTAETKIKKSTYTDEEEKSQIKKKSKLTHAVLTR